MKAMEVKKMNNYYWNKRNVSLDKDENDVEKTYSDAEITERKTRDALCPFA